MMLPRPAPAQECEASVSESVAEPTGAQGLVDVDHDPHRAEEVVALGAGVLTSWLAQLGVERLVDVVERLVIAPVEHEGELVGHDPPALDVDAAIVVHLAQQPTAELDRTDAGT